MTQTLRATVLLAFTMLHAGLASGGNEPDSPPRLVIEGPVVYYAPGDRVIFVRECDECARKMLKITADTTLFHNGEHTPLPADLQLARPADVMYDPKDMTVVWLRPRWMP